MAAKQQDSQAVLIRRENRMKALATAKFHVPVTFSIVGVQKAATSTTYRMLTTHPMIVGGPDKEIRQFAREDLDWVNPDYSTYVRPSNNPDKTIACDATPLYLFWPRALERMHAYKPDMPLIGLFRDPIDRAFSQWSMERSRDPKFPTISRTIKRWLYPEIPLDIPESFSIHAMSRRSLYLRGLYGQQLERGMSFFPREQWLCLDFSEITRHPNETLDRITDHVGIPRFETYPEQEHRNKTPNQNTGPAPTVEDIQRLVDYYAPDLARFTELSGVDVRRWSTMKVANGELSVTDLHEKLVSKLGL